MGYIPPVNHNQNTQYRERDVKNDYDPFSIKSIHSITPSVNGEEHQRLSNKIIKSLKRKKSSLKKIKSNKTQDRVFSEITGKGKNFNESI